MNDAPPDIQNQCDKLLVWMQDRSDHLCLEKDYDSMLALYMEWCEWIEEDNPSLMVLGKWDEETRP